MKKNLIYELARAMMPKCFFFSSCVLDLKHATWQFLFHCLMSVMLIINFLLPFFKTLFGKKIIKLWTHWTLVLILISYKFFSATRMIMKYLESSKFNCIFFWNNYYFFFYRLVRSDQVRFKRRKTKESLCRRDSNPEIASHACRQGLQLLNA